jgi:hypothetical protein
MGTRNHQGNARRQLAGSTYVVPASQELLTPTEPGRPPQKRADTGGRAGLVGERAAGGCSPYFAERSPAARPAIDSESFSGWIAATKLNWRRLRQYRRRRGGRPVAAGRPVGPATVAEWDPPRSPYQLLEEWLWRQPWQLLVGCILLNKTTARQVSYGSAGAGA